MSDFLLELLSEEIPARMQAGARAELEKLFRREMDAAGVTVGDLTVYSTPRRLALIARELPTETEAVREEAKGPPEGAPDQAVEGFCRKNGVTRDQLEVRDVKGRNTYFAVIEKPGRAVKDLLAEAIPAIIRDFAWPKSMRWGDASISTESPRWVRPLSGIVAILGEDLIECGVGSITSGYATVGHRFHHQGEITIGSADDYVEKLRACHVIVDHAERQDTVRAGAKKAAKDAGLKLVEDEGLVIENAGLTEWPVPLFGRFDEEYLDVPPEVIQLTARVNQKYFVCEDANGKLANAFICTANIEADDPAVVVDGNRKVLAARLSDARFFWDNDRKTALEDFRENLARIKFHEKLSTLHHKELRMSKLASLLVELDAISGTTPYEVSYAASLAKADLETEMVGEFPELQGVMGWHYANAEGQGRAVADAIRDHYKPIGPSDEVPDAPVTVAVGLADKIDSLVGFFGIGQKPTGSKDPFALRRAALGAIRLITENNLRLSLARVFSEGAKLFLEQEIEVENVTEELLDFFADRLKVQQREAGVRHDLIDAVFALGGEDDLVRLLARVKALQSFIETEDGTNLLAGYKRAANILKKEEFEPTELSYSPEPSEKALIDALDVAGPKTEAAIADEDFAAAMSALATLRAPIDRFFEDVIVNAEEKHVRAARLTLLSRFRDAVHQVADFSRIEG